jgi:hypothetical protein
LCYTRLTETGKQKNKLPAPPPPPHHLGWSGTESTITETTTGLLYQLRMMTDDDECGAAME